MKNNIMIILPIVLILDLVIPFILAPSYKVGKILCGSGLLGEYCLY